MSSIFSSDYEPPTLETLPRPSGSRPLVNLAELPPKTYVDTLCRVAHSRTQTRRDKLGPKVVISGLLEDSSFRVPFVSHKTYLPLTVDSRLALRSVYVHEFNDRSLLVVLTEYSSTEPRDYEDIEKFIWNPTIESIVRPIRVVTLNGIVTRIFGNSGFVKRCNKCRMLVYDVCPNQCLEGWSWDVRISCRLSDGGASMKAIFSRHLVPKFLDTTLADLLYTANANQRVSSTGFDQISYSLSLPESFEAVEAVLNNASRLRKKNRIVVLESVNVAILSDEDGLTNEVEEVSPKDLDPRDPYDSRILRKMIEAAIRMRISQLTHNPPVQGLHLLEEPLPLYGCERAKLYLGFSLNVRLQEAKVVVEATPQSLVRESLRDYVLWRRSRGATDRAIEKMFISYRPNVVVDPSGSFGVIEELIYREASRQTISSSDQRTLPEFWREVYGIEIDDSEIPLIRIRLEGSEQLFTYPPSRVYFDKNYLFIRAATQRFVESKKSGVRDRAAGMLRQALEDLRIGKNNLPLTREESGIDFQRWLKSEIHTKVLGKDVNSQGRVVYLSDQLCFFPERILQFH